MKITVFGGAHPRPGEPAYEQAYHLGKLIGSNGNTILTGGYMGTMEAISKGAREAGGHVIGVTCAEIERWRDAKANPFVTEEIHFETLLERLNKLIEACDAAIALPGGIGTLAEISLMWNRLIIGDISPKPLILVGEEWKLTLAGFFKQLGGYTPEEHRLRLTYVENIHKVSEILSLKGTHHSQSG